MAVVIYTRFSPRPDAATSQSCEVQEQQCREHCAKKGWAVRAVFNDADVSGSDEFRPKLWQAIEALKKGDTLLVFKRDRLARNVYLAEQINRAVAKQGATIVAISGDIEGTGPEAVLVRQIVAAMAEYERKLIGIRTSMALRAYQRSGKRVSCLPPFGYAVDPANPKRIVECASEKATIALVKERRAAGMGLREIARSLDPALSRSGKWHPQAVARILAANP